MSLQCRDGGVRLRLQLQQRDRTREIADEGVLRLVVVSERESGLKRVHTQTCFTHRERLKDLLNSLPLALIYKTRKHT